MLESPAASAGRGGLAPVGCTGRVWRASTGCAQHCQQAAQGCRRVPSQHSAVPSLGFSKQELWSGLPLSSPVHESETEVTQLCPTLRHPMDCSLPGSSVCGIFQARVLEWVAIVF